MVQMKHTERLAENIKRFRAVFESCWNKIGCRRISGAPVVLKSELNSFIKETLGENQAKAAFRCDKRTRMITALTNAGLVKQDGDSYIATGELFSALNGGCEFTVSCDCLKIEDPGDRDDSCFMGWFA